MSKYAKPKLNEIKLSFLSNDISLQFSWLKDFIFDGVEQGLGIAEGEKSFLLNLPSCLSDVELMIKATTLKQKLSRAQTVKEINSTLRSGELDQQPAQWLAC